MILSQIVLSDTLKVLSINPPRTFVECLTDPSTVIAICAILISIIGLWVSVKYSRATLNHTITHNKLSIEPFFEIYGNFETTSIKMIIKNVGFGTAIIKSMLFKNENKTYNVILDLINDKEIPFNEDVVVGSDLLRSGCEYIAKDGEIKICLIDSLDPNDKNSLIDIFKKTELVMEFETLYGERRNYTGYLC